MKKEKRFIKYSLAIFISVMLFVCIWGIPLKGAKITVKAKETDVGGTFTGMWSPVKGKNGTFTADEGWIFEGIINPDGGMWKGFITNFPHSPEERENSVFDLPEFYTGAVEDNTLVDVSLKIKSAPSSASEAAAPLNSELKPPRTFQFVSESEYRQLSGSAKDALLTCHSIPSQQITEWFDCSIESSDGWSQVSFFGENIKQFDRDKGRCAIMTADGEAVLEVDIAVEGAIRVAFSDDLTRYVVIPEDKSGLFVYSTDGGILWSFESDPILNGLYFFSASFFEGNRYIAASAGTEDHRQYCAVIDTQGENSMLLEGSEDIVSIPGGIALKQAEFGYSNILRKRLTDYITVTLSDEGTPEATLVETPEQLLSADLVVLSGWFEYPIYSAYDHQLLVRKFFTVDNGGIKAVAVIPDIADSNTDLSEFHGISGSLRFIPSPGGKWLAMVDDFKGVRLFPFISADDPDKDAGDFALPDPSSESGLSESDRAALEAKERSEKHKTAEALSEYLYGVLSPGDFSGTFTDIEGGGDQPYTVTLSVWYTDKQAVKNALAAYTGEMPPVELKEAKLSLAGYQAFCDALATIALTDGESIEPVYACMDNRAEAYITASTDERKKELTDDIKGIVQSLDIPSGNYRIYTVDTPFD